MPSIHKGSSGSPYHISERFADEPLDPGNAQYQSGPRVGAGVLGRRVTMEVQRAGSGRDRGGNGKRNGNGED